MNATITRKSRNLGIAGNASPSQNQHGWYFEPMERPTYTGGCATILREVRNYKRTWPGGTYYRVDLFVGGKRVSREDGSHENLMWFCSDDNKPYGYRDQSITVTLED